MQYNHKEIEKNWQKFWADNQTFKASNESEKPKYYVLDMFPYPSGAGLHVGHPLGYIASDIYARYKRHKGFNVLHPQGYDSFGLPAEQYAIQTGQHPAKTTEANIKTYRRQLDQIGFSFDWSREVRTSNPEYYKWTQWIFIQLFNSWYNKDTDKAEDISTLEKVFKKEGNATVNAVCDEDVTIFSADEWKAFSKTEQEEILLQYRLTFLSDTEVNWCPALGTVLANDEIVNGVSERGGHPVIRKKMTQWSMRISAYAQRLLDGLEKIDWPQPLKDSQTNWIGRSQGAMVTFKVEAKTEKSSSEVKLSYKELEDLKELRQNLTKAETTLWNELKNKKGASKFRKKYTVGAFLVDYVCIAKNLIVEFSGKEDEAARTEFFHKEGFNVIRFTDEEVLQNVVKVVSEINFAIQFPKVIDNVESKKEVTSNSEEESYKIDVFTTRPDTIYGVSFMTLAPEHELVSKITTDAQKAEVEAYVKATAKRSERDRMADVKTISGAFTGAYAIHPFSGEKVQIWIGDYVLASYGTGAVMAVPCGDQRDYDFAKHFNIPIPNIFEGVDISEAAHADKEGTVIANSDFLSGLKYKKALKLAIYEMEKRGFGYGKINYRLRDAVFSRQRYWGEPFPVYYKDGMPQMIDEKHLPIVLPEVEKYLPTEDGKPPLGNATEWAWDSRNKKVVSNEKLKNKTVYPLELNTMPGWAGSSWYFNRYMDAKNSDEFASKENLEYWKEVDLYIGGSEHATGHLLYARFWQKFLFDKGIVPVDEFAKKLINQGMILGTSAFVYKADAFVKSGCSLSSSFDDIKAKIPSIFVSKELFTTDDEFENVVIEYLLNQKIVNQQESELLTIIRSNIHSDVSLVNASDELDIEGFKNHPLNVDYKDAEFILEDGVYKVGREVEKMSKSKYNVVNPDDIVAEYGADALRMFEMFLGPLEQTKPWKTSGISGVSSFLKKLWKLYFTDDNFDVSEENATKDELKTLHKTIKKVEEDIENFSFNTSVSTFMIAVNELTALKCNKREILEPLLVLLSPYAPHITEELWSKLGHTESISTVSFPVFEPKHLVESAKNYPISFNGKMRFTLELPLDLSKEEIEKTVMAHEKTQAQLQGRTPKKVIIVPGKIVNIVG
ncbi:leucine--tRNA ligase [Polaribacter reichenbachii]|uniref:Leucine--tRNA ligase n=1 Tax=Polaribacter reichenbachii TaxID=996801 RepID=A0A1B8U7G2_9FLAO|nr:class I tRNA ligase family protein [Polaribacter reichenbachii]APZ46422.1 leucine--tRNA ligase [Polaribacter reichenbachii]AUC20287.1 leucine--tRNA ligase [Polaribacter reichenbachii]OBY67814.1 leucine--tRNA ligase [Polaribacter reichenbachii]